MKNLVYLEDLVPYLGETIVRLKLQFIRKLLCRASKSNEAWKNKEFAVKLGVKWNEKYKSSLTIKHWFAGKRNISFKFLPTILKLSSYTWKDIEKNLIFIKSGTPKGEAYIKFPIVINEELGSIVGHILGDGSIDKKLNQPFYTNQNKELLKEFFMYMENIFGVKPRIWMQTPNNFINKRSEWIKRIDSIDEIPNGIQGALFYPKICGTILIAIFGKFAFGKHKEITKEITKCNSVFKKALIRSFFDDEGGPNISAYDIRVHQDNMDILKCIREMLVELGIQSNKMSSYLKKEKNRYRLLITGHYNFIKFSKLIGFTSSEKRNKLDKMIHHVKTKKTFRLKHGETKGIIISFLQQNKSIATEEILNLLRGQFPDFKWDKSTVLQHLSDLEKSARIYKKANKNGYLWSKVVSS